ncbi:high-affinity branched-chain amino acid ABC transporter ATP-binding protein LivG [Variovorax sp. WS11]|uniref:ABC transporter ATP-binding protein n=1 Tax=Variovorax sp. WS11 TaxID=1105204 RepID=UPI000D0E21E7|nr:ABC transporter ATP-binding protein [Variovorax sp. WS11]NDZ18690.1 ABC transporter ATP-binding protein [Variovorax sp. WS11]PSL83640.1 high-affinity branched-chain amino acid ABC transporter ATP-binding protein LivG [Variovorax sp. WS11]
MKYGVSGGRRQPKPLLEVRDITVRFGGVVALDRVSFDVAPGEICGLIGPNGAGKTTLFNCLSRLYASHSGEIRFAGQALGALPQHRMAGLGIGRTFQNLALFRTLTVQQNIAVGTTCRRGTGWLAHALRLPAVAREELAQAARVDELIDLLHLGDVADAPAGELPFGTQKRVELARALASSPRLLLLDEPACGLNHQEVDELAFLIRTLRRRFALTVLLVEHHMGLVMALSDNIVALNFGRKVAEGLPAEVRCDPELVKAYLGESAAFNQRELAL